jgi:hypothetical protein
MKFYKEILKALLQVGLKSLTTGDFWIFVSATIVLGGLFMVPEIDRKEVVLKALDKVGLLGYPITLLVIVFCRHTLNREERSWKREMDRVCKERDRYLVELTQLPIKSSRDATGDRTSDTK